MICLLEGVKTVKIVSSRRDELLKKIDEKNRIREESVSRQNEQRRQWYAARDEVLKPLKNKLEQDLSKYDLLNFNVNVDEGWDQIKVDVSCNDDFNKKNAALHWSYRAVLDTPKSKHPGRLNKETSSWSGLSAVTSEELDSLRQTLEALEYLNGLDWENLMNIVVPEYGEYVTEVVPSAYDFQDELKEATVKDIIGTDTWIACHNQDYDGHEVFGLAGPQMDVWVRFNSETPEQYRVSVAVKYSYSQYSYYANLYEERGQDVPTYKELIETRSQDVRVSKRKINIVEPIDVLDEKYDYLY